MRHEEKIAYIYVCTITALFALGLIAFFRHSGFYVDAVISIAAVMFVFKFKEYVLLPGKERFLQQQDGSLMLLVLLMRTS